MEKREGNKEGEDGWDNFSDSSDDEVQLVSLYKHSKARAILEQQYSLEPDMATGWMPKLPSCPIPLTYQNTLIQAVLLKIDRDPRYQIIYRGPRNTNSVQLHKTNGYRWKYREKYEVKVNAISEAVENVGKQDTPIISHITSTQDQLSQNEIKFDSDFESGNLDLAIKVKPNEYDCFIRSDTNTKGHTNWYYFKVRNKKQVGTIQFNICNIVKPKNLYNKGMTPYSASVFHDQGYEAEGQWRQNQCHDVKFVERLCRYGTNRVDNQLQFKYDFKYPDMEVSFAYSIPYTFSRLQQYIASLQGQPHVKVSTLCQSLSGLELPLITIAKEQDKRNKINFIITARIHPGQTNASHMLEGFLTSLLDGSIASQRLLSSANFYVVPLLNPDGVVAGNYRTSFSGRDLNRSFNQLGHFLYPEINGLVDLIKKLKTQRKKVDFFFDFHSHSSKKDLFSYGPEHPPGTLHYFRSRVLAKILEKQDCMFKYDKCIFHISEYKKTTARSYMLKRQKIPMTFTFEISNGLYSLSQEVASTLDRNSLLKAGKVLMLGLNSYFCQYHRELIHQPRIKILNFKDQRHSLLASAKNYHKLRKTIGAFKSQDLSFADNTESPELQTIINEIISEKSIKQIQHQQGSDSQCSDHDMSEDQLQNLFAVTKQFQLSPTDNKTALTQLDKGPDKLSLTKIKSKKQIIKLSVTTAEEAVKENVAGLSSGVSWNKYRRNRIYYEQTHPRATKKLFQNVLDSKKAIKQKKFPILF